MGTVQNMAFFSDLVKPIFYKMYLNVNTNIHLVFERVQRGHMSSARYLNHSATAPGQFNLMIIFI